MRIKSYFKILLFFFNDTRDAVRFMTALRCPFSGFIVTPIVFNKLILIIKRNQFKFQNFVKKENLSRRMTTK